MSAITDKLNAQMPGLALSYDKTTGALNRSAEAMKTAAKIESDKQKQIVQQQIYAESLLKEFELQEQINQNAAESQKMREEYYRQRNENPDLDYSSLLADIDTINSETKRLRGQLNESRDVMSGIETSWAEQANAVIDYETAVHEAVSGVSDDLQKLIEDYDKTYEAAHKSIDGTIGLFNEMSTKSNLTTQQMLDNMKSQLAFIEKYEYNIREASRYGINENLVESLSGGGAESAGYIDAIVTQYQNLYKQGPEKAAEFVENFNKQFEGVQSAKDSFAATVAEMTSGFDDGIDEMKNRLTAFVDEMNMSDEAAKAAKDTATAYIDAFRDAIKSGNAGIGNFDDFSQNILYSVKGYAAGTLWADSGLALVGEKGPELVDFSGGETVYPADETAKILYAGDRIPLNIPVPENPEYSSREIRENRDYAEKKISIDINGTGEIKVSGDLNDEEVWEIVAPRIKPEFIKIVRQEVFEEGDRAYNF
ncbi:MAG: hypothetical protein FWF92_07345 [Oscillospiraceae bacterium]|nr:hypothetical protein [Oscillospiraceae bacterium]